MFFFTLGVSVSSQFLGSPLLLTKFKYITQRVHKLGSIHMDDECCRELDKWKTPGHSKTITDTDLEAFKIQIITCREC